MGKVCNIKGCASIAVKDGRCPVHQQKAWAGSRPSHGCSSGWEWGRLRVKVLAAKPYCFCGAKAEEVHHKVRGSKNLNDLETYCKAHHKAITQRQAATARANNSKYL